MKAQYTSEVKTCILYSGAFTCYLLRISSSYLFYYLPTYYTQTLQNKLYFLKLNYILIRLRIFLLTIYLYMRSYKIDIQYIDDYFIFWFLLLIQWLVNIWKIQSAKCFKIFCQIMTKADEPQKSQNSSPPIKLVKTVGKICWCWENGN